MSHDTSVYHPRRPLPEPHLRFEIDRIQRLALLAGAGAMGFCALVTLVFPPEREAFFRSYLFAYTFWLGLTLGCTGVCMMHNLTGGRWGQASRRILEAGGGVLPLMTVLGLPLALGAYLGHVWPWASGKIDPAVMPHKAKLLDPTFVMLRVIVYFAVWLMLVGMVQIGSRRTERTERFAIVYLFARFSGLGIVLYTLTLTGACMDWLMSLTPQWYSTVYGLIFLCGQALAAFSFAVIVLALLMRYEHIAKLISLDQVNDLASFMFAFTILWAYMSLSQFLISWMGNLKNEMLWYVPRTTHGWGFVAVLLLLFQFFAPFLLLLNRKIKRTPEFLMWVAVGILVMRVVDIYWIIKPSFGGVIYADQHQVSWMDLFLPAALGGFFVWGFCARLKRAPLTPPPLVNEYTAVEVHETLPHLADYHAPFQGREELAQ